MTHNTDSMVRLIFPFFPLNFILFYFDRGVRLEGQRVDTKGLEMNGDQDAWCERDKE